MVKQSRGSASHSCLDQHNSDKKTQRNKKKTKTYKLMESRGKKELSIEIRIRNCTVCMTHSLIGCCVHLYTQCQWRWTQISSPSGHRPNDGGSAAWTTNQRSHSSSSLQTPQCFIALELHWNTGVLHFLHILLDYSNDIFGFVKWKHISQSIVCRRQEQNLAQRWKEICRQSPSDVDPFLFII